jgi:hypothetical protein
MSYKVGKYIFETEQEARDAQREAKAVAHVYGKLDMEDLDTLKRFQAQLQAQPLFHTVIGRDFMDQLQKQILHLEQHSEMTTIDPAVQADAAKKVLPQDRQGTAGSTKTPEQGQTTETEVTAAATGSAEKAAKAEEVSLEGASQAAAAAGSREIQAQMLKYKKISGITGVASVAMLIIIICMFVINGTSDSPTILNYEQTLLNKYAGWETELDEREQALAEREQALNEREQALDSASEESDATESTETDYVEGDTSTGVIPLDMDDEAGETEP